VLEVGNQRLAALGELGQLAVEGGAAVNVGLELIQALAQRGGLAVELAHAGVKGLELLSGLLGLGGEPPAVLVDDRVEQVVGGRVGAPAGGLVQRGAQRPAVTHGELTQRPALLEPQRVEQRPVQMGVQDPLQALVGLVAGQLLGLGRRDCQLGQRLAVEALATRQAVLATGQLDFDQAAHVAAHRLHLAHRLGPRRVLVVQHQRDGLQQAGLAGLVGRLDDGHPRLGERHLLGGDAAEALHGHAVQPHGVASGLLRWLSRNSNASASTAVSACSPPVSASWASRSRVAAA
jgi:hypothetical protein